MDRRDLAEIAILTWLGAIIIWTDPRLFVIPCALGTYAAVHKHILGEPYSYPAMLALTHGVFAGIAFYLNGI